MSLKVNNIVKKYGDKVVVNDLSFAMENPGVYALLGRNGAGKTTTIRVMLGMLSYESGEVLWKDKPLDATSMNVGYLAEERGLYPKYSLMDQLLYFASLKNVPQKLAKDRIAKWAAKLEVEEYLYPPRVKGKAGRPKKAEELSKGNQQKIQLMAALLSDPELIILDEPLSGLDPVNTDLFKDIIRDEIAREKYIIMSSHQMPTIEEFCEDITILNGGNTALSGNLNEIKKSYGRVNLSIKVEGSIDELIERYGLKIINKTPNEYNIKVNNEEEANKLLKDILDSNTTLIKFELREPTLHEIFVEKVGGEHAEK